METRIIWLPSAFANLDNIFNFLAQKNENAAVRLVNKLYSSATLLKTFPQAGPLEYLLESRQKAYRSLVVENHFKLIYYIENEVVYIAAIWDIRQDFSRLTRYL